MTERERADYAVVVSISKSGTNLVSNLMKNLGYKCVGHGLRESYEEMWAKLARFRGEGESPWAAFSRPEQMMRVLKEYPKYTCLFLHRLEIGPPLLDWCTKQAPPFFYNYRDPRDTLVSLVNYLLKRANDQYSEMAWNMIHARILGSMSNFDQQLMYAIQHMDTHTRKFRDHTWMLHHPDVCKVAYERLVGPRGGGEAKAQEETVRSVMDHLGVSGDASKLVDGLYDTGSRTFHRGKVASYPESFKEQHDREFQLRYGDVLKTYGYA